MITVRNPGTIYQARGQIRNGTFHGRWHFSFDQYYDLEYINFGSLRVFNDDTLSPGAVWPLHPHRDNEVVTYCAAGEFRHEDHRGKGGVLKKGWVQHTTIGRGMWHSEINNKPDEPMRFIQMWFSPTKRGLEPSVEQKKVEKAERTNKFLPLVSNTHLGALRIVSDAAVFSCFLEASKKMNHKLEPSWGAYLYVVEGGSVEVNGITIPTLGAAKITDEEKLQVEAKEGTELLLVDVLLTK